jgi:hypothetical protein
MVLRASMVQSQLPHPYPERVLSNDLTTPACTDNFQDNFTELVDGINKEFPNTKVIGYPYKYASEEETLGLIDDVLNSWGRYI